MLKLFRISLLPIVLFLFYSCNESKSSDSEKPKKVEFNLTGNDQMKFNLNTMVVGEGDSVLVNFENIGKMAKEVMGHNFVLLKSEVDIVTFAAKAFASKNTDYIPEDETKNIIAQSILLGPGEKTVIEFIAPPKGTYKYICSFPGHYVTMQGTLIVR